MYLDSAGKQFLGVQKVQDAGRIANAIRDYVALKFTGSQSAGVCFKKVKTATYQKVVWVTR